MTRAPATAERIRVEERLQDGDLILRVGFEGGDSTDVQVTISGRRVCLLAERTVDGEVEVDGRAARELCRESYGRILRLPPDGPLRVVVTYDGEAVEVAVRTPRPG